ncbi:AMP-dependent synthetase/ligase [Thermovibrio ammonificans]|uniref:AMP-dependent synthetase and ligase n=1 Tax=Thermovibrio ammonificans (strain DSM 15698 / JCM 12110 / HB-1) TaxID=648996 RepID=E8T396_THEA1|nr:AMP-binding protein [Thermovibrio ammonificans]ADU97228.1 AMP-dependent synthetase and ligase [Thermovibrio ammonificans HB-1]
MGNFLDRVFENIREREDKEILVGKKGGKYYSLNFSQLGSMVANLQRELQLSPQDRVVIFMENRPEWIGALYAVLFGGGIAVPVDYLLSERELFNILKDSQPRVVVTSNQNYEKAKKAIEKLGYSARIINVDSLNLLRENGQLEFKERNPEDVAVILYTSGTTGNPKGVMLSLSNLDHNVKAVEKLGFLNESDRFIAILPFHHTYPLMATALLPMALGLPLVFIEKLTPADILSTMNEQQITIMVGVPKLYHVIHHNIMAEIKKLPPLKRRMVEGALKLFRKGAPRKVKKQFFKQVHEKVGKHLRFMISGGAKLSEEVWRDFEAMGFNVLEGYGLTETSPLISVNRPNRKKIGSAGLPVDQVEVKISEKGEIVVRGPNVMKGYYNKPEETAKVIKEGWFHTGDLGYIDEEGFIHITGRAKEVIVLDNGKNVYPEDIEIEILKSPYILEVGVFYHEGKLKAIVRPDFELLMEEGIKEIKEFIKREINRCTRHLQPYKKVKEFAIVDEELPRTRIGKLRRFLLPKVWEEVHGKK